jgi:hypothetical protein
MAVLAFTADQRFFIAFARINGGEMRDEAMRLRLSRRICERLLVGLATRRMRMALFPRFDWPRLAREFRNHHLGHLQGL